MLDDVQCTGSENKLLACSSAPILQVSSNCDHSLDAGARCDGIYLYKYSIYIYMFLHWKSTCITIF